MPSWRIWAMAAVGVAGMILLDILHDEPNPCTTYNEMRQIHIETNGEYGWPKGATKECEDETQ